MKSTYQGTIILDLEQARILLEKMTGQKIMQKELATALGMTEANISRKITSKTKLKQRQISALESFYNIRLPQELCDTKTNQEYDFDALEKVIIAVEEFCNKRNLLLKPFSKARLITSIYRVAVFNKVEVTDVIIENFYRLMEV